MIEERGWNVLNGNMERDEHREFTFIGKKGKSVIDDGLVSEQCDMEANLKF